MYNQPLDIRFITTFFNYLKEEKYEKIKELYLEMKANCLNHERMFYLNLKLFNLIKLDNDVFRYMLSLEDLNFIMLNDKLASKTKAIYLKFFLNIKSSEISDVINEGFNLWNKKDLNEYGSELFDYLKIIIHYSKVFKAFQNSLKNIKIFLKIFFQFFEVSYIFIKDNSYIKLVTELISEFYDLILNNVYENKDFDKMGVKFHLNFLQIKTTILQFVIQLLYMILNKNCNIMVVFEDQLNMIFKIIANLVKIKHYYIIKKTYV